MKKTKWYPAAINPVRVGKYEVFRPGFAGFKLIPFFHVLHWNGSSWEYAYKLGCSDRGCHASMWRECKWRGLTKETL